MGGGLGRTDHIMLSEGPEVASQASAEPIQLDFWAADAAGSRWRSPAQNASLFEDLGENRIDFKRRANWQLGLVAHVWDSKCVQGSDSACDRVPWFRL